MDIRASVNRLLEYVREGELCACPFIRLKGSVPELAIFTYVGTEEKPVTVYGYGQMISTDGSNVVREEKELFEREDEIITIRDDFTVSAEIYQERYERYYDALQNFIDDTETGGSNASLKVLSSAFKQLVSQDAMELYRRVCPEYLALLNC